MDGQEFPTYFCSYNFVGVVKWLELYRKLMVSLSSGGSSSGSGSGS